MIASHKNIWKICLPIKTTPNFFFKFLFLVLHSPPQTFTLSYFLLGHIILSAVFDFIHLVSMFFFFLIISFLSSLFSSVQTSLLQSYCQQMLLIFIALLCHLSTKLTSSVSLPLTSWMYQILTHAYICHRYYQCAKNNGDFLIKILCISEIIGMEDISCLPCLFY